ncbi:SDR family oxidoreductase [Mucilaginibacter sp. OK098]|uniref:SDR family oxidoreductase n=1 Tax=Mucilaginibacter sp. OK098 TaxID=1855297 RepID=UPI0009201228|nr:SDR family oxidoreductase [Mucilaginibacter sp. OK098]SHM12890.1 Nucleoside-diphosphate-sugar epimerase [Mucilaginibacter sp. OK098]
MIVSILGCGWYGKALAKSLLKNKVIVKGSATSPEKLQQLSDLGIIPCLVNFKAEGKDYDPEFFKCDILIISIPPKARQGEGKDYPPKIQRIINVINRHQIAKVIYISSTVVYGDSNGEVNELDSPKPDTESGKTLLEAENLFKLQIAFKTTIIRFAGLVGPGRHPGRFFAGKKGIPNGLAPVNLIHLEDCLGITLAVIEQDAFGGLINASSPDHPAKSDFYLQAALRAGLTAPEFINELNSWKLINSVPIREVLNYEFKVPAWHNCTFD